MTEADCRHVDPFTDVARLAEDAQAPGDASTTTPSAARTPWPAGSTKTGLISASPGARRAAPPSAKGDNRCGQRIDVGFGPAAESIQQRPRNQFAQHRECLFPPQAAPRRKHAHRRVLEQFRGHAAHSEQDCGAERIAMHAEDQFRTARDHFLDKEALRLFAGLGLDFGRHGKPGDRRSSPGSG